MQDGGIASGNKSFFDGGILLHLKLLVVAASWGLAWVAGRELATSLPEAIAAWYRYAITVPLLFIWLYVKERKEQEKGEALFVLPQGEMFWKITWIAFFSTFLYQLFFMYGVSRTAAGDASVIITFNPAFTALIAIPLLNRRVSPTLVFGLIVGLIGVIIVTGWSPNDDIPLKTRLVGDFFIMCAAASWAVSTNLIKAVLEDETSDWKPSPLAIVAWSSFFGLILLTPLASFDFIAHGSESIPDYNAWLWIFYLAAISTVLAYAWFADGVDEIGATAAATYVYLVPFFGILSGWMILEESIGWSLFAGLALILIGVKVSQQASNEYENYESTKE